MTCRWTVCACLNPKSVQIERECAHGAGRVEILCELSVGPFERAQKAEDWNQLDISGGGLLQVTKALEMKGFNGD